MKKLFPFLLALFAVGCVHAPHAPAATPANPHAVTALAWWAAGQTPAVKPARTAAPLPIPTRAQLPPPRLMAGFPSSVPLSALQQGGAASTNVIAWNGSAWAPAAATAGSVSTVTATSPLASSGGSNPVISIGSTIPLTDVAGPTGTGVALVSGGAFSGAAGTVDLSSGTYVANQLGFSHGGTGTSLSCSASQLVQGASSSTLGCNTLSLDGTLSAGALTIGSIGAGNWTVQSSGVGIHGVYNSGGGALTLTAPGSDLPVGAFSIEGMPAYAGASSHVTGGDLVLYGGPGASANGTSGNIHLVVSQTGSGALPYFWIDLMGLNSQTVGGTSAGWQVGVPLVTNFSTNGNGIVTDELGVQTTTASPSTISFPMGSNSYAGNLIVIVSGKASGSATHVTQTWTANFSNNAGTCALSTTNGAWTSTNLASSGTVAATPISVALSGCTVVGTVTGTSSTTWNWSMTVQAAVAGGS